MPRDIRSLVAAAAGVPVDQLGAQTPEPITGNARKRAYEAGKQAARMSGMSAEEMIVFIEGFRAGLMEQFIE